MKISGFALLGLVMAIAAGSCERQDDPGPLSISVSSDMECKNGSSLKSNDPAPELSCIRYSYDGDSILVIQHLNAAFNCCPEGFAIDIEVIGDSLIIREDDEKQLCKCNCLYDLEIRVRNLPADQYHIRIVEPYVSAAGNRLIFDLDLKNEPDGEFCVTRAADWWR
jgi:hypothetical protein